MKGRKDTYIKALAGSLDGITIGVIKKEYMNGGNELSESTFEYRRSG